MFCVKTASRTYEMSASDTRQRQEWTAGECGSGSSWASVTSSERPLEALGRGGLGPG